MLNLRRNNPASKVEVSHKSGTSIFFYTSTFNTEAHFVKGAKTLNVDINALKSAVECLKADSSLLTYSKDTQPIKDSVYIVRTLLGAEAVSYRHFSEAIADTHTSERVIAWNDIEDTCCLDIDNTEDIDYIANTYRNYCSYIWVSHSGKGLHLIFYADDKHTAVEKACVIGYCIQNHCACRCEYLKSSRHPRSPRDGVYVQHILTGTNDSISNIIQNLLQSDDREYRDNNKLEVGKRYPHTLCPGRPSEKGQREPVMVFEEGIKCYYCAGQGLQSWFPNSMLNRKANVLADMVRNKVHYGHAKYFLPDDKFSVYLYSALLKQYNDTPTTVRCLNAGSSLIRYAGHWGTPRGEVYTNSIRNMLCTLPHTQYNAVDGMKTDHSKIDMLDQPIDLSAQGYYPVSPIWGINVNLLTETYTTGRVHICDFKHSPRYTEREVDEKALLAVLPGLNLNYLRLLIAAKAYVDSKIGMIPIIYVSGPSSAAKSATVKVAATMCGDKCTSVVYDKDKDRRLQAIAKAGAVGSWIVFDEINKDPAGSDLVWLLNLDRGVHYHEMYIGQQGIRNLPAIVLSDITVSPKILADQQLGRRIVHVPLFERIEWERPIASTGVQGPDRLRDVETFARVADAFVSDTMRRYLSQATTFKDVAAELGFYTMSDSVEAKSSKAMLAEFFHLVESLPAITEAETKRIGSGYKRIELDIDSPIKDLWESLSAGYDNPAERIQSESWGLLLGDGRGRTFKYKTHGRKIYVKFSAV